MLVQCTGELIGKGQVPQLVNVKDLSTEDVGSRSSLAGCHADAAWLTWSRTPPYELQRHYDLPVPPRSPGGGSEPPRSQEHLQHFPTFGRKSSRGGSSTSLISCSNESISSKDSSSSNSTRDQIIRASDGKAELEAHRALHAVEAQADAVLRPSLSTGKLRDWTSDELPRAGAGGDPEAPADEPAGGRSSAELNRSSVTRKRQRGRRAGGSRGVPRGRLHSRWDSLIVTHAARARSRSWMS